MDFLNLDITNLSYAKIKEILSGIDLDKMDEEQIKAIIAMLKNDSRKNVLALSKKIQNLYDKKQKELANTLRLYDFDRSFGNFRFIAGVDEVGRGPLAGPIVSAAVILDLNTDLKDIILGINDSKVLSEEKREQLAEIIKSKALAYNIALCDNEEIDSKGIGFCNNEIFKKACYGLSIKPDLVLSDGYTIKGFHIENKSVIKGDAKSASIACASIIAKVYRDRIMKEYHKIYPYYDFINNVGYGTKKHIEGIMEHGICKIHRESFLKNIKAEMHLL